MEDYRTRIYEKYATEFQDATTVFDSAAASRWGKAYDYYFRGWMPEQKSAAIADLACGGGKLLYFFKQRGYTKLCGVDISPEQVQLARHITSEVYHENILDFLKAHPDSFDLITGLDIIEHFHKDEVLRFLDLCFGALKEGGRLIIQTSNAESPLGATDRYGDLTHELSFTPRILTKLLQMCRLRDTEAREQGPVPRGYSLKSSVRYAIWQGIRAGLKLWNIAETGGTGSGVFTRIFLISGGKV